MTSRRTSSWRKAFAVALVLALSWGSSADYDRLLRSADALIEMPCHLVTAIQPREGASCYRLNWPLDPLDYVNMFTEIEFDRAWSMDERGQYRRPFTLMNVAYEVIVTSVSDREHYLAIQHHQTATPAPMTPSDVVESEFIASRLVDLYDGTITPCLGHWAEPFHGYVPSCVDVPEPVQQALQSLDTLAATNPEWSWVHPEWSFVPELRAHSNLLAARGQQLLQAFSFMVLAKEDGSSNVIIQEMPRE